MDFAKLVAYAYDHLADVVVVLSGSQVGLLYDMLKVDDPASPLYGRAIAEIRVGRLSREKAIDLLSRGFAEVGVEVGRDVIERAVDVLDGVVGWLTYFGWSYSYKVKDLEEILNAAAMQEAEEIRRFLARSRSERRYRAILKIVAEGKTRWSEIKRSLEFLEGIEIDDKNFNELLTRLTKAEFIEKIDEMYKVPDIITARAILRHL
jgi:AAA+ ATPase superfamily predicted ATPase